MRIQSTNAAKPLLSELIPKRKISGSEIKKKLLLMLAINVPRVLSREQPNP